MTERLVSGLIYLAFAASLHVCSVIMETALARLKKAPSLFGRRASVASVGIILGHYVIGLIWMAVVVIPVFRFVHQFAPLQIGPRFTDPLSAFLSWPVFALILLDDFVYYVHHIINHKTRFFWAIHQTHHSSNEYNVLVATRVSWFDINTLVFWLPLTFIGFDPDLVLLVHFLNILINIFIHTKLIGKLPVLDAFIMTPSNHRIHHAVNQVYLNKNYGGALVVWDKIFGTYAHETEPVIFETSPDLKSERVLEIATKGVRSLFASHQCKNK